MLLYLFLLYLGFVVAPIVAVSIVVAVFADFVSGNSQDLNVDLL
jgi:hypothetical protein